MIFSRSDREPGAAAMPPERPGYLIGLDLGTSAIKGVLTDAQGQVLAEAEADSVFLHPREGWVEVDPGQHYRHVREVIRELATAAPGEVAALAMAAASGNTLLTDADGEPLANIINWLDGRVARQPPAVLADLTPSAVRQITGWPCVMSFPLGHLAWLREQRGSLYARAGHIGMDTDWLVHKLTGRWVMDHSTAATFHLRDQRSGAYHAPFLEMLDIPLERLSALAPSGTVVGPLTAAARRVTGLGAHTLVVAGCFDHPAAARCVGVLRPGQLMLSCGTSWVGFLPCLDRQMLVDAEMLCDPFLSADGGPWAGMFSVPAVGRKIDWYIDNLIAPGEADRLRIFDESAAQAAPGAGGLAIDLREPPRRLAASRADISRAVMEGAARLLNEKLRALHARGFQYDRAVMVGGPARSPIWPGIVAETTGLEVTVGRRSAGAQGAALLAAVGVGFYESIHAAHVRASSGRKPE
jgi:xylulokinase